MNDDMASADSKKTALAIMTAALPRAVQVLIDLLDSADKELAVHAAATLLVHGLRHTIEGYEDDIELNGSTDPRNLSPEDRAELQTFLTKVQFILSMVPGARTKGERVN